MNVRRIAFVPMMTLLLLLLSGCRGAEAPHERYRRDYQDLTSYEGEAEVTADYGDKVYQYQITLQGNERGGEVEVTEPASIAGTGYRWQKGSCTALCGDITLATGHLSEDGLSPADAMPVLLAALASGREIAAEEQTLDGKDVLFLELSNPNRPEEASRVQVWLDRSNGALCRGEILWQDKTVITVDFNHFSYTAQQTKIEG